MPILAVIIGAGRRGATHAAVAATISDLITITAIADVDPQRVHNVISTHVPHARPYTDALTMLHREHPQLVYITTPPPLHTQHTLAALELGAHVILEKPIALTLGEAEQIGETAARLDRIVHVCHQLRYLPGVTETRTLLTQRPIALTHIWNYRKGPDIPGNWNRDWGGGHVVEWGIHYLDLCRYLMNTEAAGLCAYYTDNVLHGAPSWDNWDAYAVSIRWRNGAVGAYGSTYALHPDLQGSSGLTIIAKDAKLESTWNGFTWKTPADTQTWAASAPREGERNLTVAVLHAIATRDQSRIRQSYADALRTHRLVLAANQSALSNQPIAFTR